MIDATSARRAALLSLLMGIQSPEDAAEQLSGFGWDSAFPLVLLTTEHAVVILERYLSGDVTAVGVERWANAIEGRDDIGYEHGHEALLSEFVFEMANPDITKALDPPRARSWIGRLHQGFTA